MTDLRERYMRLGLLLSPHGHHWGAWRLPEAQAHRVYDFSRMVQIAQIAERGFFDMLFMADVMTIPPVYQRSAGRSELGCFLEPVTTLSALSAVTSSIGLAGTMTTSYYHPFHVARMMASLDHISGGRAGWNVVTSANPNEAALFGLSLPAAPEDRYRRAREFVDVVCRLWDSWDDDAFKFDTVGGQYFDLAKMHPTAHHGEFFKVDGLLSMARPPQGRPLILQAGQSGPGMQLAAETADLIFTQQPTLEGAQKFYKAIKHAAAAAGRSPADVFVMPGLMAYVGSTEAEARAQFKRASDAFDPIVGVEYLSVWFGIDLSPYPLDEPLPKDLPHSDMALSMRAVLLARAERDNLTLRDLVQTVAVSNHWVVCGTPEQVADEMERYFTQGGADAFNVFPGIMTECLDGFVDHVVPELQRRGLVRTTPAGKTLREKFGLNRPMMP